MGMLSMETSSEMNRWVRIGLFLMLGVCAFVANILTIELFIGVELIFGSIFVILALHIFGLREALLLSILSNMYTYFSWHHPYGILILAAEIIFLGVFLHRKRFNLLLADMAYWIAIGIPLVILFYVGFLNIPLSEVYLIMLKQAVNGLLNTLIAGLLIIILENIWKSRKKKSISFQVLTFHILLSFILIPLVGLIIYEGKNEFQTIEREINGKVEEIEMAIQSSITLSMERDLFILKEIAGIISASPMNPKIETMIQSTPNVRGVYLTDLRGKVAAQYPQSFMEDHEEMTSGLEYRIGDSQQEAYISSMRISNVDDSSILYSVRIPIRRAGEISGFMIAAVEGNALQQLVDKQLEENIVMTIHDSNARVIATSNESLYPIWQQYKDMPYEVDVTKGIEELSEHKNLPKFSAWTKSYYTKTTALELIPQWTMDIKVKVEPYKTALFSKYVKLLLGALLIISIAFAVSYLLSRWMHKVLEKVALVTTNLPERISMENQIIWPSAYIEEISKIIENIKKMEHSLRNMFIEEKNTQRYLQKLAHFDQLTNLLNRSHFEKLVNVQIEQKEQIEQMAVMFIDLDRFKLVNDTAGHKVGDELLIRVADRMRIVCQNNELVARFGGDEFTILQTGLKNLTQTDELAKRIIHDLALPFTIEDEVFILTASIGISIYPQDGQDFDTLIKNADMAMYKAKEIGKNNYTYFNQGINDSIITKVELEAELREAIKNQELRVFYQPQVELNTNKITGVEALVRWFHPSKGIISPLAFIPLAEETGLIMPLGKWILQTACEQAVSWQTAEYPPMTMSVNISMRQFLSEDLVEVIEDVLNVTGFEAEYLKLEITESVAMNHPEKVIMRLEKLSKLGLELALDDFGTGYSSLNYLKNLPIDILKIDQSFIREISHGSDDFTIVKALIDIAHKLGIIVIAEGVETEEQRQLLEAMGCNQFQGYLFSKPLPPQEFERIYLIEQQDMIQSVVNDR